MARRHEKDRRRPVASVVLESADISVVNRATLSLWHFQQLAQQLLPRATESADSDADALNDGAEVPEDDENENLDKQVQDVAGGDGCRQARRHMELGEGMDIAAIAYKVDDTESSESDEDGKHELLEDSDAEIEFHAESAVAAMIANNTSGSSKTGGDVGTVLSGARLTATSEVSVVYKRYRCVICLDASPSTLSIDPATGRLFLDMLYESVELFVWALLGRMAISDREFAPEIHLSVMVQGAQVESLSVLVQGYIVNPANVVRLLQIIKERIQLIEDDWAVRAQEDNFDSDTHHHATRASLSWILQNAVFALNSLPSDAAPILALVTDGVVDLFDAYSYDNLLMQLVRHDVQCHFLRVGGGENAPNSSFGFVPDVDLLRFIAGTTSGTVFDFFALHEACYGHARIDNLKEMTSLQEACFLRKSNVHAISTPVLTLEELCCTSFDGRTLLPLRPYRMWREKVHEYRIFADVERIIEARVREGFTINKVHVKTSQKPVIDGNQKKLSDAQSSGEPGATREVTKILIVFLLQWKQNVWLEYVVSSTTETSSSVTASSTRRLSMQGLNASGTGVSFTAPKTNQFLGNEQSYAGKWSEWYVKVNVLAYSDFLRAFEDSVQSSVRQHSGIAGVGSGSPYFLHEYIRNVQDVDRVLLHLMTATAAAIAPVEASSQFSFGTSGQSSAPGHGRQQNAHPVFNIIGELSPVLWHRWFYVERFELLCVVKNEHCEEMFYPKENHDAMERGRSVQHKRNKGGNIAHQSRGFLHLHGGNPMYGVTIGIERITDRLMATLMKWSSQRLSKDLFLRFLLPSAKDKNLLKNKGSGPGISSTSVLPVKRQQRNTQTGSTNGQGEEPASIDGGSKSSLCFVRVEIKNKTLCAIHVAFFSTTAAARKHTLNDLKASIIAGVNDTPSTPLAAGEAHPLQTKSVVLSQRLIGRLLVTHDTLLLHDGDQSGSHDHEWEPTSSQAVSSCCGGSELQLRSVFGAYMWHSSWQWHIANPAAMLNVMRRLHEARIGSGFWVMDWKMDDEDEESPPQIQSVIFGREILMEDENGNTKTSLVQYGLRRVSSTCLVTSFWMEPQHGTVKTRLSRDVEKKDTFHWGLKHAVGHDSPFEGADAAAQVKAAASLSTELVSADFSRCEEERRSMEREDVSVDWNGSTYLGENELLQLIRGYIFKKDRHFLSCLYTFDCVMNFRESIQLLSEHTKRIDDVIGSSWDADKLLAAENGQLLPPFSTARLLGTAKRSSEHFLMYLDSGTGSQKTANDEPPAGDSPKISLANEHLYSMLERTLRGLSDCEVSWTDFNGNEVSGQSVGINDCDDEHQLLKQRAADQMPLWLKNQISSSLHGQVSPKALSKGKCFAKLVSADTVVLAFLPSLDTLQVKQKGPDKTKKRSFSSEAQVLENRNWPTAESKTLQASFSRMEAPTLEAETNSQLMRMSVSADDIVLYQERRLSFREGYKSWRMGHYQGSRDEKQSSDQDFNLCHTSTPEDHEFCDEISRQAEYGHDSHLLIERASGELGSGFFQVAFYECSIGRLACDSYGHETLDISRLDLSQRILKQLFASSVCPKKADESPMPPADKRAQKQLTARSPAGVVTASIPPSPVVSDSSSVIASRRFQKKVKLAHEHNFSRGVYIALREGDNVQQSDLIQALTSCIEVPVDLDITLLYRMMQASSLKPGLQSFTASNQRDNLKDKLDKSFEKILSSSFVPIRGTKYYYFSGSENAMYDEGTDGELHFLMDDADAASDSVAAVPGSSLNEADSRISAGTKQINAFSPSSKPPLPKLVTVTSNDGQQDPQRSMKPARRFKDHERPPPVKTSAELSSGELHPGAEDDAEFNKEFQVHNRRHIFVYRDRGGHVFYMKISIKYETTTTLENPDRKRLSRVGSGPTTGLTPTSATASSVAGILLEVFGVCEASEEVTQELCRVLERKLDEATQLILMKILARNAKLQLSPSDMAFVCPPGGKPAQVINFLLPEKLYGATALLQFLSQTLSSAPYIRHVSNVGQSFRPQGDNPNEHVLMRSGRRRSTFGLLIKQSEDKQLEEKSINFAPRDATLIHPAMFFASGGTSRADEGMSPEVLSPVFFSSVTSSSSAKPSTRVIAKPNIVDQTAYVLNLNPELRLSPGFLSRVGRGLAVVRIDLIYNQPIDYDQRDEDKQSHLVKSLEGFDEVSRFATESLRTMTGIHHVVRCQLWTRGSINTNELSQLLESNLREAMLDHQIETTLKVLSAERSSSGESKTLSQEVLYLTSLFERSCRLSSASVTKLLLPTSIASWDIEHVINQFQSILRCMPSYLRPAVYSKKKIADEYETYISDNLKAKTHGQPKWKDPNHRDHFRLVARLEVVSSESSSDLTNSQSNSTRNLLLGHSESIQSDMSELDSMAHKVSLTWTSMSGSDSNMNHLIQSSSSSAASVSQPAQLTKEFSESELLLYPNSTTHGSSSASSFDGVVPTSHEGAPFTKRSFYYVIDVSSTDGVQFYGYNMSSAVVDTLLVHFARVLTWSKLRERLLRNLLLEKSGLSRAAPLGSKVVHPRDLYADGGGSATGKNSFVLPKDFCVDFVDFWRPAMVILTENTTLPRVLDASLLRSIEGSSLGKYLREAHTLASDRVDAQRPRAISNVSIQSGLGASSGPPELHREVSSQSSQRSVRSDAAGPLKNMTSLNRGGSSSGLKADRTVPSPTKRGVSGGPSAYSGGNAAAAAAANPRMRGHAGAANALLAARARARGALPGRLGGAGAASKATTSGDSVAPWDLPLTNTKGPMLTGGSGAPEPQGAAKSSTTPVPTAISIAKPQPNERQRLPNHPGMNRPGMKSNNSSQRDLSAPVPLSPVNMLGAGILPDQGRHNSSKDFAGVSFSWRKQLEFAWGPRFKFCESYVQFQDEDLAIKQQNDSRETTTQGQLQRGLRKNPLHHFSDAFQKRWQEYEARSTSHTICLNLFDKLVTMKPGEEMEEAVSLNFVNRMMQCGHHLLHQRFRVTFVERWEVVKVDEEYMEEDMQDGRLRALQASMDLVNLLSYKKEFVFHGNECTIANFYTEHTVLGMCANEGDAVREMKKQIMKNIFHLKMEVAHDFYERYAVHLRSLGFRHLRTLSSQNGLRQQPLPTHFSSTSLSSLSAVDLVASDGEGFSEYFYYSSKSTGKMKGWSTSSRGSSALPPSVLLLELKCDHHGVRLGVVLVNESDLQQQDLGFQNRLEPPKLPQSDNEKKVVSGEMIKTVSSWLRDTLRTRAIIYGFTIRFFQKYLTKWSNDNQERTQASSASDVFALSSSSQPFSGKDVQSFQNIVKGIRCFLHAYPEPPLMTSVVKVSSDRAQRGNFVAPQSGDSLLRTAVVELPPTQLHSNCSESILVKILLRYIACHGARYEVLDLMQFGTPDAVVCHSPSGSFFHRQAHAGQKPFGHVPSRTNFNGYSLLITTQSLVEGFGLQAQDKKRRKNCIQLILLKSSPTSLGVGNGVLPVERALVEAEYFVQELFRVAAQHYERDLLWSRLLYDDTTGPGAKVASTLALPSNHFEVEVGPQQLEECLRLSVCTPLEGIDPTLAQLMGVEGVCWQEFALRLRDLYSDQLREYQFEGEDACHFLLLCPNTHDLIIHLTFEMEQEPLLDFGSSGASGVSGVSINGNSSANNGKVKIEICRREEPPNRTFTFAQRRVISEFVNSIVHWQWRSLLYD
uniref:Protein SZT2 n=1 Tax=Globisporangium ultimum (strain ATCC 200006 / CBS 805.95 / DAOM BR144) TaxID=431595 RepID=K3WVU9_GLOUD